MSTSSKTSQQVKKTPQTLPRKNPQPDAKAMIEFIRLLHPDKTIPVCFQTFGDSAAYFFSTLNATTRDRVVSASTNGLTVSVVVNHIVGNKRSADNVTKINALFIDCDNQSHTLDDLQALPVPPHIIVETSPGNFHAYWLVRDCDVGQFKTMQKALAVRYKTDPQVCDLARAMRLPGTINWKGDKPFLARIVHRSEQAPISLNRLIKKLKLKVESIEGKEGESDSIANKPLLQPVLPANGIEITERIQVALDSIDPNERSNWLYAGMAIHSVMSDESGYELWTEWSKDSDKYDADTQLATWNGFKPGNINIGTLFWLAGGTGAKGDYDNFAMGALFAKNFVDQLRYDDQLDKWFVFNSVAWREDKKTPIRLAKALIKSMTVGELRKQEGLAAYRSPSGLSTIVKMAETENEVLGIAEADFNRIPTLLATQNGVVDLETLVFRQALPADFLRRQVAVPYDAAAKCPRWIQFIREITCEDKELARFLRLAVGYTLFGHGKEQVFFVLDGAGSNGKGVFLRILHLVLGEFAVILPPSLITSAFSGGANSSSPALMAIQGTRMGIVTETSAKKGFDTAFMKQISGSDPMSARANYGAQTTIKPECKLWLSTNNMPEIRANDDAMWRRIVPIPFKAHFTKDKRDNDLESKLKAELPGILNWALRGARDYAALPALPACSAVAKHKHQMQRDADVCGTWLKECTAPAPKQRLQSSEAYASYAKFAKKIGREPMNMQAFKRRVETEGHEHKKSNGYNVYIGLALKEAGK